MNNLETKQKDYDALMAGFGQCAALFDLFMDAKREIVERIDTAKDIPAQIVQAASELVKISAQIELLPKVASKLRKRAVLAHGELLCEQWRELNTKLQAGGLNSRQQQDLSIQLSQCRAAVVSYFSARDTHLIDPLTADFTQAANKAAEGIYKQMTRASAETTQGGL